MLRCQYCWGYWSGGWFSIGQSQFLPPSLPPSIFFLTVVLFISKCVSAAVLTPASCQGQTRKETGFDGELLDKKHTLMERWMIGGPSAFRQDWDGCDASNTPDHMHAKMKNRSFALSPLLSASRRLCCCYLLKPRRVMDAGSFIFISLCYLHLCSSFATTF